MVLPYQQHQKLRQSIQKSQSSLSVLRGVPFWIWDKSEHLKLAKETNQQCCFQHIVGCPTKSGSEYPLFDYQKLLIDTLMSVDKSFKDKHLYLLKSTGIGASELFLRLMAWLCVKDDTYCNSQMVIVTGPNLDLAVKLVRRMKAIFEPKLNIVFDSKETVLELNGCTIEAYPSNHLDSFRSLTNPAFLLLDELDFIRKSDQDNVRHISERYIGKSNPYIVLVSTPNMPGSLMENIKKESEDTCIYKRLFLDYHYGLNKIYTTAEIEKAKMSPSFEREYCLKFSGHIGNLLSQKVIDSAVLLGEQLKHIEPNPFAIHSLGIDPAFGSSAFGMVLTEHIPEHDVIRVLYSEQFDNHPDPNDMIKRIFEIHRQYHNLWIFVDASARGFITSLKIAFGENINYQSVDEVHPGNNKVLPINFSKEHKSMISHLAQLFEDHKVAVPEHHDKLIIALKTAVVNEYALDKESTSFDDIFDATRLSLKAYHVN
jgi:Terminase RNaseH-like domain